MFPDRGTVKCVPAIAAMIAAMATKSRTRSGTIATPPGKSSTNLRRNDQRENPAESPAATDEAEGRREASAPTLIFALLILFPPIHWAIDDCCSSTSNPFLSPRFGAEQSFVSFLPPHFPYH
jgi:hypothetical protein